jgi:GNAT superfamily N-acetyltransferase
LNIRPASFSDLPKLAQLSRQGAETDYHFYPPPIRRQIAANHNLRRLLAGKIRRQLILVAGRPPLGFISGSPNINQVAVINWLYVDPSARSQGLARSLLAEFDSQLESSVHKIMLWTEIAPDYYRHLGWKEEARLPNHWWGRDFWIFSKYRQRSAN